MQKDDWVSAEDIARVYNALLKRVPEATLGKIKRKPIDFCLGVALSRERRIKVLREHFDELQDAQDFWVSKLDYGHIVTHLSDKVIGSAVRTRGGFQEDYISGCLELLDGIGRPVGSAEDRGWFLDVGSNIGTHSLYAFSVGFTRALCIEPDPLNFRLLRINQILNDVDSACVNLRLAVSDFDGVAELELSPSNFGDHRVKRVAVPRNATSIHGEDSWQTQAIPTRRLDRVLDESGIDMRSIGIAWIDTQGHEGHVLRGAPKLIEAGIPIVAELWPYGLQRSDGYARLRRCLEDVQMVLDLRESLSRGGAVELSLERLDEMFDELLRGEAENLFPHTDLLIL